MFVQIPGYSLYLIDENANLLSFRSGNWKKINPIFDKKGYMRYHVKRDDGVCGPQLAHRLLMKAWVGESDLQVDHKDGNKQNNSLDNLEYVTNAENAKRAGKLGLKRHGQRHRGAKITVEQAKEIRSLRSKGSTYFKLVEQFGLCYTAIRNICMEGAWEKAINEYNIKHSSEVR